MDTVSGGHRSVPHTADVRVEAWSDTRESCLAQTVLGMVDSFAWVPPGQPVSTEEFRAEDGPDTDLLVAVLEEVIFIVDTTGRVPVAVTVADNGDDLLVRLDLVAVGRAEQVGAVPKAVSLHELRIGPDGGGWRAAVTLDV